MPSAALLRHTATPCDGVDRLAVDADLGTDGLLTVRYAILGDVGRLRIPAVRLSSRTDGLWQHTCFEAFITTPASTAYFELNFAPSTEWAAYRFRAYREGMNAPHAFRAPTLEVAKEPDLLELRANFRLDGLHEAATSGNLRLALAAVIEEIDGRLSYWALTHPLDKPDFHHPGGFVLGLARAGVP